MNSLVSNNIRTILGDLTLEATSGNIILTAGLSILLSADPTLGLAAATKQYVDAVATGLDVKNSVRVTTDTTLAATRSVSVITATGNGAITIDGVLLSLADRILVKNGLAVGDTEVAEVTDLTCVAKASYTDNTATPADYFDISTHLNTNRYRVYFDFTGAGVTPAADGRVLTQVDISGDTSATDVGVTLDGVLSGLANMSAINAAGVVTVTNDTVGDAENADGATAVSVAGMTVTVITQGVSDGASNGIYAVTTVGDAGTAYVLTRATDADEDNEVQAGLFTFTEEGTICKDIGFVLTTNDPITVNFTAQTFSQFSSLGGDVSGPGAGNSTDEALVRWDTTSGKLVQDSLAILDNVGVLSGLTQLNVDNLRLDGNTLSSTDTDGDVNITPDGTGRINTNKIIQIGGGITKAGGTITGAITLGEETSGTSYDVTMSGSAFYRITLPFNPIPGTHWSFMIRTADSFTVEIQGGDAAFYGTYTQDSGTNPVIQIAFGTTLEFVGGTALLGDSWDVYANSASTYRVIGHTSVVGGLDFA